MPLGLRYKIGIVFDILRAKAFAKRIPLFIGWNITNRCNSRCRYCNIWQVRQEELSTREILSIVNELKGLGTRAIAFDGGEPLIRDDIGEIVSYCKNKRLILSINTNGLFVPKRIKEIRGVDYLKISFDGPQEIHDFIRGGGAYRGAIAAIRAAKENGIDARLNTTLTKYNLNCIDFILNIAKEWNLKVKFQPVRDVDTLFPKAEEFKQAIGKIIFEKRKGNRNIVNSLRGLRYIYNWPNAQPLNCYAGILFCRISSNGNIYPCNVIGDTASRVNCREREHGFGEVFKTMSGNFSCTGCWCATSLELNYVLGLKIDVLSDICKTGG